MKDWFAAWRERPLMWIMPLAFVSINLLLIVFFQTVFSGKVASLERNYDNQASSLENMRTERKRAERFIEFLGDQQTAAASLYDEHFATEGERFTAVLRDVRKRAREAGMDPQSFSYPEQSVEAYGLNKRNVNFAVEGTYDQLRRFINLLELTDQFVTLESVKLGNAKGGSRGTAEPNLAIRLSLSTIFVQGEFPSTSQRAASNATSRRGSGRTVGSEPAVPPEETSVTEQTGDPLPADESSAERPAVTEEE